MYIFGVSLVLVAIYINTLGPNIEYKAFSALLFCFGILIIAKKKKELFGKSNK